MTPAPVGLRCPEHSGKPQGAQRVTQGMRRASFQGGGAIVTKTLIAINVAVWLAMLATGSSISSSAGTIFEKGALFASGIDSQGHLVGVAHGQWYRLVTAMFLHASLLHIAFNMLALWWVGRPLEQGIGRGRFLLVYFVSGLAGSAGALFQAPFSPTVGASGAIFGILGALFVLERRGIINTGGQVAGLIVLNLVFTFAVSSISRGGHIGGLVAGAVLMLAFVQFRSSNALALASAGALALASIAVAYGSI
jgi:membrane associated rhomboid family serine protease